MEKVAVAADRLGTRRVAFVQTDVGFVYVDKAGDVFIADGHRIDKVGADGDRRQRQTSR